MPGSLRRACQNVRHGEYRMSNPYNSATERASILGPTLYFKGD